MAARICAEECASLNIFAKDGCPCHLEAYAIATGSTLSDQKPRTGVRVTRDGSDAAKHNKGDK